MQIRHRSNDTNLEELLKTEVFSLKPITNQEVRRMLTESRELVRVASSCSDKTEREEATKKAVSLRDEVIARYRRTVWYMAMDIFIHLQQNKVIRLELIDLFSEGDVGLCEAVTRWNPNRKEQFSSYANKYIRFKIFKFITLRGRLIRMSDYSQENTRRYQQAFKKLEKSLRRTPTIEELSEETGFPINKTIYLAALFATKEVSFGEPIDGDTYKKKGRNYEDIIVGATEHDIETTIQRGQIVEAVGGSLGFLGPRERLVIERRFCFNGEETKRTRVKKDGLSLEEIGEELGVSGTVIEVIEKRAMEKIRRRFKSPENQRNTEELLAFLREL